MKLFYHPMNKYSQCNVMLFYRPRCCSQFVAHPNVQQLLASIWYEGLPGFRRKNMALQTLEIVRIGKKFWAKKI